MAVLVAGLGRLRKERSGWISDRLLPSAVGPEADGTILPSRPTADEP